MSRWHHRRYKRVVLAIIINHRHHHRLRKLAYRSSRWHRALNKLRHGIIALVSRVCVVSSSSRSGMSHLICFMAHRRRSSCHRKLIIVRSSFQRHRPLNKPALAHSATWLTAARSSRLFVRCRRAHLIALFVSSLSTSSRRSLIFIAVARCIARAQLSSLSLMRMASRSSSRHHRIAPRIASSSRVSYRTQRSSRAPRILADILRRAVPTHRHHRSWLYRWRRIAVLIASRAASLGAHLLRPSHRHHHHRVSIIALSLALAM